MMYHAHFKQTGTNDSVTVSAKTSEELETLIYGRAYGPKFNSVTYWTTHEDEGKQDND
jgi:hypothetical protein